MRPAPMTPTHLIASFFSPLTGEILLGIQMRLPQGRRQKSEGRPGHPSAFILTVSE
jgi:hypothetical protein